LNAYITDLEQKGATPEQIAALQEQGTTQGFSAAIGTALAIDEWFEQQRINQTYQEPEQTGSDKPLLNLINNTNPNNNGENNMIEIPPLTPAQYAALSNFNTATQVSIFLSSEVISIAAGGIAGYLIGGPLGALVGSFAGAVAGTGWAVYESNCMNAIQGEIDRAYQNQSNIQIWRQEGTAGLYMYGGGNSNDTVTLVNGPLSNLYLGIMTWSMTGQLP
jgi:hypothetical protein